MGECVVCGGVCCVGVCVVCDSGGADYEVV